MIKEELEKEAGEWLKSNIKTENREGITFNIVPTPVQIYCAGAEPREKHIEYLEQQIDKMKRHCNCKHRDSEGYCEVKRTYLIDLSYDGCDKWELED